MCTITTSFTGSMFETFLRSHGYKITPNNQHHHSVLGLMLLCDCKVFLKHQITAKHFNFSLIFIESYTIILFWWFLESAACFSPGGKGPLKPWYLTANPRPALLMSEEKSSTAFWEFCRSTRDGSNLPQNIAVNKNAGHKIKWSFILCWNCFTCFFYYWE